MLNGAFTRKNLLPNGNKMIGIYGTGLAAKKAFEALSNMKIDIQFFLDGDRSKIGEIFCGKEIKDLKDISKDTIILIAANPLYEIHERLENEGIKYWEYVDPEYLYLYSEGFDDKKIAKIYNANEQSISQVYRILADEESRKVFVAVLEHRRRHDLALINDIYNENQYFGNDIIGPVSGTFVDCGAFTGDTLKRFMNQLGGGKYQYFAFEAEEKNCNDMRKYCEDNKILNVQIYNMAVYDKRKYFVFQQDENDEKVGGRVSDNGNDEGIRVQGNSLDNVLGSTKIDMITMDIEGAEIHALYGARNCISKWNPKLAISAYHCVEHLWEIPLLIKEFVPAYKIYYRHHRWNMHDTVCYAIR